MAHDPRWSGLGTRTRQLGIHMACIVIDAFFLCLWVVVQWGVQWVASTLPLSGVDKWALAAFRIMFAVATLVPVVLYIYADLRIMLIRAGRRVEQVGVAHHAKEKAHE